MYYCIGLWTKVLSRLSRIVVKQTNFNWEMLNMFNIIKTLQNYFPHELLPYNLSSEVALHFNVS